jgi:Fe-S-cluster-containing hydrogenase component 2
MPVVVPHKCPQDHPCPCVRICPVDAVYQQGFSAPRIDKDKCIECAKCVRFCPYQAIAEISQEENIRVRS